MDGRFNKSLGMKEKGNVEGGGYRNITMTVQHGGIRSHEDCILKRLLVQ